MIPDLPLSEIATLAAALAAGGLLMGFLAGLLGIGGGGIVVPILYELFRIAGMSDSIRMQVCVATSLAVIVPTSIRSARSHWRHGAMDFTVIRRLGPWIAGGAVLGVFIASHAPSSVLKAVFVASTLFMAWHIAFGNSGAIAAQKLPGLPWDGLAGAGIGLISTLIGIGGGVYITTYMRLFGWPIHKAVGTASGFGPIIAIPAVARLYRGRLERAPGRAAIDGLCERRRRHRRRPSERARGPAWRERSPTSFRAGRSNMCLLRSCSPSRRGLS